MVRLVATLGAVALLVGSASGFQPAHMLLPPRSLPASNNVPLFLNARERINKIQNKHTSTSHFATRAPTSFQVPRSTGILGRDLDLRLPGVYSIMLAQAGVFIADNMTRSLFVKRYLYLWHSGRGFRLWQPLTACFCHRKRIHLANNLLLLLLQGRSVQSEFGTKGVLLSFGICGIVSNLVSMACLPARSVTIGASGALMGLYLMNQVGYLQRVVRYGRQELHWRPLLEAIITGELLLRTFVEEATFGGRRSVNMAAHLGGAMVAAIASRWILSQHHSSPFNTHWIQSLLGRTRKDSFRPLDNGPFRGSATYADTSTQPTARTESIRPLDHGPVGGSFSGARAQQASPKGTGSINTQSTGYASETTIDRPSMFRSEEPETSYVSERPPWAQVDNWTTRPSSEPDNHGVSEDIGTRVQETNFPGSFPQEYSPGELTRVQQSDFPGSFPQEASPGELARIDKPDVGSGLQRTTRRDTGGAIQPDARIGKRRGKSIQSVETMWANHNNPEGTGYLSYAQHRFSRLNGQRFCNEDAFSLGQTNFGLANSKQHRRTDPPLEYDKVYLNGVEVAASVNHETGRINYGMTHTGMKVKTTKHWWQAKGREHEGSA